VEMSLFLSRGSLCLGFESLVVNRRIIETKETPFAFLSTPVAWPRQRLPLLDFGRVGAERVGLRPPSTLFSDLACARISSR
jgi:hypothetical protein